MDQLLIPVNGSDQFVAIPVSDLPSDPSDIIEVLIDEVAPLKVWLKCAITYYKKGNHEAYKQILTRVSESLPHEKYKEDKSSLIAILNSLASYYTRLSRITPDRITSEEYHKQATQLVNKADKIDIREEITWVGKGISQLFLRKRSTDSIDRADKQFTTVLEQNPNNIPALLGKACILFKKNKYQEALDKYKQVITLNPGCPASVRLGIAYCYHHLNRNDLTKLAIQRVLDMDPDIDTRVDALVNLAILETNEGHSEKAVALVKEAYNYDNTNSKVLNQLANLFFDRGDYDSTQSLALKALNGTTVPKIQAESNYYLARLYHSKNLYLQAETYYHQATQLWPEFILPQFGLGQLYLLRGETEKAMKCLEKVLNMSPDNYETLKILGALYAEKGSTEKALAYLKRAMAMKPDDIDTILELVQILETNDYTLALHAYEKAADSLRKSEAPIPPEIWNNMGVLHHQIKNIVEAEKNYRKALVGEFMQDEYEEKIFESLKPEDEQKPKQPRMRWNIEAILNSSQAQQLYVPVNVTVTYNLARLYEDDQKWVLAKQLYDGILKAYPNYTDCLMRLGLMSRSKGEIFQAREYFKEVMTVSQDRSPSEAWSSLGNLHLDKREWKPAQKIYEVVLKEKRNDPYVTLQIANIFLSTSRLYPEKKLQYLKLAQNYFFSVLSNDPNNIYAANGIAIVFKELGLLDEAKDAFMQVREATSKFPDVWINIAHVHLLQGQYENAIRLYQTCLREFYGGSDATVFLYLAKAYFEDGRLAECKTTLQKAIRLTPWNTDLWYNLALALKENAQRLSDKNSTNAEKMASAILDYQSAIPIFDTLSSPDPNTRRAYSTGKCKDFLRSSRANLVMAMEKYKELKDAEDKRKESIEQKRQKAEQQVQERLKKKDDELKKEALLQQKLEEEAEAIAARTLELSRAWNAEKEGTRPKKKSSIRKKRKSEDLGMDEEEGTRAEDMGPPEDGNASPSQIASSLDMLKKARKKRKAKKKEQDEKPEKKRRRLSKAKQKSEKENTEEPEGTEDGVVLFDDEEQPPAEIGDGEGDIEEM